MSIQPSYPFVPNISYPINFKIHRDYQENSEVIEKTKKLITSNFELMQSLFIAADDFFATHAANVLSSLPGHLCPYFRLLYKSQNYLLFTKEIILILSEIKPFYLEACKKRSERRLYSDTSAASHLPKKPLALLPPFPFRKEISRTTRAE